MAGVWKKLDKHPRVGTLTRQLKVGRDFAHILYHILIYIIWYINISFYVLLFMMIYIYTHCMNKRYICRMLYRSKHNRVPSFYTHRLWSNNCNYVQSTGIFRKEGSWVCFAGIFIWSPTCNKTNRFGVRTRTRFCHLSVCITFVRDQLYLSAASTFWEACDGVLKDLFQPLQASQSAASDVSLKRYWYWHVYYLIKLFTIL